MGDGALPASLHAALGKARRRAHCPAAPPPHPPAAAAPQRDRAHLQPGETVLIHSALGGVGSAAVAYAQSIGCSIIASAGNAAKRATLAAMPGIVAVLDSRDSSGWADAVKEVTGGRGADVLLNSLAGDKQLVRGWWGALCVCVCVGGEGHACPTPPLHRPPLPPARSWA